MPPQRDAAMKLAIASPSRVVFGRQKFKFAHFAVGLYFDSKSRELPETTPQELAVIMRRLAKLLLLLSFWRLIQAQSGVLPTQWPLHDDALNTVVQWDHYSFELHGQRIFLFAGEFHYWRLPVPGLWLDILQKIKAAGFTAFTFYTNWAWHAPNNTTLDFSTGAHDYTLLLEIAKDIGLYVFLRPGPYINAEVNAGGFPLWLTTGAYGTLRNNDTRYTAAWKPYFAESAQIISKYQITNGQNIIGFQIENEYGEQWDSSPQQKVPNDEAIDYMELLETTARSNGITIPLTANEPNMGSISWDSDWSSIGGNVDVTGLDSYPSVCASYLNFQYPIS